MVVVFTFLLSQVALFPRDLMDRSHDLQQQLRGKAGSDWTCFVDTRPNNSTSWSGKSASPHPQLVGDNTLAADVQRHFHV